MPRYVDGFVIPVPKRNVAAYASMAKKAGKVWKEYGALDYIECVGDELASLPAALRDALSEASRTSARYESRAANILSSTAVLPMVRPAAQESGRSTRPALFDLSNAALASAFGNLAGCQLGLQLGKEDPAVFLAGTRSTMLECPRRDGAEFAGEVEMEESPPR